MKNIRGKDVLLGIAVILAIFGGISFILLAIDKIRSGHALEYYRTGRGIETNYLVSLISLGVFGLLIIGLMVYTWIQKRPTIHSSPSKKALRKKKR